MARQVPLSPVPHVVQHTGTPVIPVLRAQDMAGLMQHRGAYVEEEATRQKAQREDAEAVRRQQALLEAEHRKAEEAAQRQREAQRREAEEATQRQEALLTAQRRKAEEAARQQQTQFAEKHRGGCPEQPSTGHPYIASKHQINAENRHKRRCFAPVIYV